MPITEWKPTPKQEEFLALPLTVKEGFYAGAVMAGKSDVLMMYPVCRGWLDIPQFKGLFLRRTMPELRNEIIPRSREYYTALGGKFNKQDSVWEFPSGALIFFGHCEHEDDVHKYDTAQWNYVAFDELTSFTEWQYIYITVERTRVPKNLAHLGLPAIVRSASNPGNVGHNWVKKRFIDPEPKGKKIIVGRGELKRIFIPATIDDNPYADEAYKKGLEGLPEAERKAKKYGDWSAYEGQVFSEFRERHFPSEPENALHVVDSFQIPDWWPKIVAIDWGYNPPAMTYVSYAAISPSSRVYFYREQHWQKTKISEWAPYVREYIDKEQPRIVKLCQSAAQERGQEHTIHQQIEEELQRTIELSGNRANSRIAGKALIHEYLRWNQVYIPEKDKPVYSDEKAQWLLRNKGINDYNDYLSLFAAEKIEENLPKLQIFGKECPLLINVIKAASHDKNNVEDVAEFAGDDPYDTLRYQLDSADTYFNEATNEFSKIQKQEKLVKQLEADRDWTTYYRNARRLESEQTIHPVMRFHRRRYV